MANKFLKERMLLRKSKLVDSATQDEQRAAFDKAIAYVNDLNFRGEPVDPEQGFAFPRVGLILDDGTEVTGIPPSVSDLLTHLPRSYLDEALYHRDEIQVLLDEVKPLLRDS